MLWTWPTARRGNFWNEMDKLHREMNQLFEPFARRARASNDGFPAVNIWTGTDNALVTAELPGVNPDEIEVTVKNDTVTIRGSRKGEALNEGESYLRQERGNGTFVRSFALPFHVDADNVSAQYQKGILQLTLPRREEDKPKRISIHAG